MTELFLALKEIRFEKIRYTLITGIIALTAYLIFMLLGLMLGLARENTAAITSWDTRSVTLNQAANNSLSQSLLTKKAVRHLTASQAAVGQTATVLAVGGHHKQSVQFVGLNPSQFINQHKLHLVAGHKLTHNNQIILDEALKNKGYHLGSKVTFGSSKKKYTVVGFAANAKLNIASVAYGTLTTWQQLKGVGTTFAASGIINRTHTPATHPAGTVTLSVNRFIQKLPGYAAQNDTFAVMIGFLLVITLVIIAIFFYILTLQKRPHYAVLRAQGIPARKLINATIAQALILICAGIVVALLATSATASVLPAAVPMSFNWGLIAGLSALLAVIGVLGTLLSVRIIARIDPLAALN